MKLIFINRFFHPDQSATSMMLSDLLSGLDTCSRECLVITSASMHTAGEDPEERDFQNVDVIRIPGLSKGNRTLWGRLFNFLVFYLGVLLVGLRCVKRDDTIVCLTDPPLMSVPVQMLARLKGGRLINWLQDIYPETATTLGIGSPRNPAVRFVKTLRDHSWTNADANVCIGERMKTRVEECGIDVEKNHVIQNWADEKALAPLPVENNPLRKEWGLKSESVVVCYSGNLGRAHDVDTMLDAGRHLLASGEAHFQFLFVGGGAKHVLLPNAADEPRIAPHFLVRGYRPRNELQQSLAVADIHWLSLEPELEGLIVPSKFYGAIAAGRPIVFIGDTQGEIAKLIREADCGQSFAKGDSEGLSGYLSVLGRDRMMRDELGAKARAYSERYLSRTARINEWDQLLTQVSEKAPRQPAHAFTAHQSP